MVLENRKVVDAVHRRVGAVGHSAHECCGAGSGTPGIAETCRVCRLQDRWFLTAGGACSLPAGPTVVAGRRVESYDRQRFARGASRRGPLSAPVRRTGSRAVEAILRRAADGMERRIQPCGRRRRRRLASLARALFHVDAATGRTRVDCLSRWNRGVPRCRAQTTILRAPPTYTVFVATGPPAPNRRRRRPGPAPAGVAAGPARAPAPPPPAPPD